MDDQQPEQNKVNLCTARAQKQAQREARRAYLNVRNHNYEVRTEAFRGVRRPGKDHTLLFQALDQLVGSLKLKKEIIRDVIAESLRFKRRALAQLLEEYMVELEINEEKARRACRCLECVRTRYSHYCSCSGRKMG